MNGYREVKHPFKVGQIITVLRWKIPLRDGTFDQSYIGDQLEVMAIDYPFIKVKMNCVGFRGHIKTMSFDKCEFHILNKTFANIGKRK